jgi:DNA-binding HxlR family transcriptional regulator
MIEPAKETSVRYNEGCLVAHALNLIGDRWALLVVRELMFAPKRFQMIRAGLPGITASVLTSRLTQLSRVGVVNYDERLGIYTLLDAGRDLLPVLEGLSRWSLTLPGHDASRFISPSALIISMRVNLDADLACGREALAGFDFGSEAFEVLVADGKLLTTSVSKLNTAIVLQGSGNTLATAVYCNVPLLSLVSHGTIDVQGDITLAIDFLSLFKFGPPHGQAKCS